MPCLCIVGVVSLLVGIFLQHNVEFQEDFCPALLKCKAIFFVYVRREKKLMRMKNSRHCKKLKSAKVFRGDARKMIFADVRGYFVFMMNGVAMTTYCIP